MNRVLQFLRSPRTTLLLFILNGIMAMGVVYLFSDNAGGDARSYMFLAEGVLNGRYSSWWWLDEWIPDTMRPPGYPLFIALVFLIHHSVEAILIAQYLLYLFSIWLTLQLLGKLLPGSTVAKNLFLLLLVPMINVVYYSSKVLPEATVLAAISMAVLLNQKFIGRNLWKAAILGVVYGFIYHCRPVFLLFPFSLFVLDRLFCKERLHIPSHLITLVVFSLTIVPYGIWNKQHHGVFSITPLEGGGGVAHLGYWAGLIPGQHGRYWGNSTADEILLFVPREELPEYKKEFDLEWDSIQAHLQPLLTSVDTAMLDARKEHPATFLTYNTRFTLERERILKELTLEHILDDPWYFIKYKTYSAIRLWVPGIQRQQFLDASWGKRISMLYPTVLLLTMLLVFLYLGVRVIRARPDFHRDHYFLYWYMLYTGLIYVPFVIQSRYTTPVRLIMLALIAVSVVQLYPKLSRKTDD